MSYYGTQYGCNPKYLSQYVCANERELQPVWAFTEPEKHTIVGVKKVKFISPSFLYEWATCGTIVTNYRLPVYLTKRKHQKYIQTWHSSLRLKMIEKDAYDTLTDDYKRMIAHDSKQIDLLISGCEKSTEIFRRAFWYDGKILECGSARNDILINGSDGVRSKVYTALGVDVNNKTILYAPTFRKDHSLKYYDIEFNQLVGTVKEKFGGEWTVLLRLHPHLAEFGAMLQRKCGDVTVDASKYDDIQDLLAAADILISDYSSLMFDYLFTAKPIFLYTPDLVEYTQRDRNLYFDIKKLPFSHALTNEKLNENVIRFDASQYGEDSQKFLAQIGSFEHGTACAQIVDYIKC